MPVDGISPTEALQLCLCGQSWASKPVLSPFAAIQKGMPLPEIGKYSAESRDGESEGLTDSDESADSVTYHPSMGKLVQTEPQPCPRLALQLHDLHAQTLKRYAIGKMAFKCPPCSTLTEGHVPSIEPREIVPFSHLVCFWICLMHEAQKCAMRL